MEKSKPLASNKVFDRLNPFYSKLINRYRLNTSSSTKETWHVVLDLKGSEITYRPGDSIAIYPENDFASIEGILQSLNFDPQTPIQDRSNQPHTLAEWLLKKVNLSKPTSKLLQKLKLAEDCIDSVEELLQAHKGRFESPQELVPLLSPLLPRFYSISSSQESVGDEVHCTIVSVRYEIENRSRVGLCSHYLCSRHEDHLSQIAIYIQPTKDFRLPEDPNVPIIMIGPGTGIAPFRAFMQERQRHKSKNWLFFGERNRHSDFFYEEFWQELVQKGHLRLDVAFSRDQEHKVYVQHKMWQMRKELWQWLQQGARIYVCGDASRMAKDVDAMLHQIVMSEGAMDAENAKVYIATLRKDKRYLRDVY